MFKLKNHFLVLSLNLCFIFVSPQLPVLKQVTEIPSDIPRCKEADQNLSECILNAFRQMVPRAINGIPELNIPPTDPLEVDKSSYQFVNNIIQGKVALRNVKIKGLSKTIFNSVEYKKQGDKFKMVVKFKTPELFIQGRFKAEVKINNAKMNSKGAFNLTMTDIDAIGMPEGEWYERDGQRYIRLTKFNIEPTLGNMRFYATGLMPDPLLNDAVVEFVNQNWRTAYKPIISETRSTWEPEFLKLSNEYFSHLPFDSLLLKE